MVAIMYTRAHKGMCARNPADDSHTNRSSNNGCSYVHKRSQGDVWP